MKDDSTAALAVLAVIAIILLIVLVPICLIWSLNTLFGLTIAFTFKTWTAAFIVSMIVGGNRASKK